MMAQALEGKYFWNSSRGKQTLVDGSVLSGAKRRGVGENGTGACSSARGFAFPERERTF
jgi:hypothetical protein